MCAQDAAAELRWRSTGWKQNGRPPWTGDHFCLSHTTERARRLSAAGYELEVRPLAT